MAEAIASVGFAVALIVGFYFGISGKSVKWNWYKKYERYFLLIATIFIIGFLIWLTINNGNNP